MSLPVWGAWIETKSPARAVHLMPCRSPCGERGLKHEIDDSILEYICRSPCGERGLKHAHHVGMDIGVMSLPVWGAWIETEIRLIMARQLGSLPVWGAWIETNASWNKRSSRFVAPRVGSVD